MDFFHLQSTTASYGQWRPWQLIQLTGHYPHSSQGSISRAPLAWCKSGYKSHDLLQPVVVVVVAVVAVRQTFRPTSSNQLLDGCSFWGRTSENSVTLTLIRIWKTQTERLTINIMGWLFLLLVWDTPSSSTCGKGPTHLENNKMRRLVQKLNIIMHFFCFFVFSYIFFVFLGFSYLRLTLIRLRDCP